MKHVTPKVYFIAQTKINHLESLGWLHEVGASDFKLPAKSTEAEGLVMMAGKRCYNAFVSGVNPNVTKVRESMIEYIDNILKSGHGSVLEHASYSFAIENVSRVFTAEMNRHRAGWAISEGSMRYIRFDNLPFWMPESILASPEDDNETRQRKEKTRQVFISAILQMEDNYKELCEIWDIENMKSFKQKKKLTSMFRRIIGMGVATGGIWTGNLRAIRHVLTMRVDESAEEEICLVFKMILEKLQELEPNIFGDFRGKEFPKPKYRKV